MFDFNNQNNKRLKRIKEKISTLPNLLVDKFGFFLLLLLSLALFITMFFFQHYYFQVKDKDFQQYTPGLNDKVLEDVLREWQAREEFSKEIEEKEYPELFKEKITSSSNEGEER